MRSIVSASGSTASKDYSFLAFSLWCAISWSISGASGICRIESHTHPRPCGSVARTVGAHHLLHHTPVSELRGVDVSRRGGLTAQLAQLAQRGELHRLHVGGHHAGAQRGARRAAVVEGPALDEALGAGAASCGRGRRFDGRAGHLLALTQSRRVHVAATHSRRARRYRRSRRCRRTRRSASLVAGA